MTLPVQVTADSERWWDPAGGKDPISLIAGQSYLIQAAGTWYDDTIACGPEGYDLSVIPPWKRPLFKIFSGLRPLDTGDRWYMLLGRIGSGGPAFEIGKSVMFIAKLSGILYLTVNDIHLMYYNNKGTLQVEISLAT